MVKQNVNKFTDTLCVVVISSDKMFFAVFKYGEGILSLYLVRIPFFMNKMLKMFWCVETAILCCVIYRMAESFVY